MDVNIIQDILIGLFVNGLSYIIGYSENKFNDSIFEKEEYIKLLNTKTDFEPIIKEILTEQELSEIKIDDMCIFLKSPGVESIVRQIYAAKICPFGDTGKEEKVSMEDIKKEFSLLLSQNLNDEEKNISNLASKFFTILITGCEIALENDISIGELSAHEAQEKYRFKLLFDQLEVANRNIEFLSRRDKPDIREINKFIEEYRNVAKKRFEIIRSASYNEIRPLIDKIYVCPNLILIKEEKMECEKEEPFGVISKFGDIQLIDINKFLPKLYRVVLLGDPGAGKSTFAQKISYDILKDSAKVSPGNCDIPIIVTLRDFQSDKLQKGISILDFIRKEIHSSFQIKASNSTFEYLFLNGYVLLIFDGLDELLDTSLRAKIVDEIESFCTLFPSIPVLVTSRKVGYNQAPLRADMFQIVELAPFESKQIEEYVNKWFELDPDLTCGEKERKIKSFLKESRIASDIRSNSLMLSLMCSIYRDENYIPTNRPEVYKKCSEMLFEKWDKNRGISPPILIAKSRVRSLLSYLAYVIFTNETLQKGINENKLIEKATEYLLETSYENEYDAEEAAKDFIHFCKGRAWVLTDTGTTKWGENIYQFTHRTFLEYFTAEWIVRKYEENLCDVLLPRICKGEWDNVSQLAFQIRYEKSEGGDKLFTDLIQKVDEVDVTEKFNLLFFASRCLGFIVPSPKIVREITASCFKLVATPGPKSIAVNNMVTNLNRRWRKKDRDLIELIFILENSITDNRKFIGDTIENLAVDKISKGSKDEAVLSFEISLNIARDFPRFSEYSMISSKNKEYFVSIKNNILKRCCDHTNELIKENIAFCIELKSLKKVSLAEIVELHGFKSLFYSYSFNVIPSSKFSSIYYRLLRVCSMGFQFDIEDFEDIGKIISSESRTIIKLDKEEKSLDLSLIKDRPPVFINGPKSRGGIKKISKNIPKVISLNQIGNSLFGAFFILAYFYETANIDLEASKEKTADFYKDFFDITGCLKAIFESRLGNYNLNALDLELKKMYFTDEQRMVVKKWTMKDFSLVE